jgi:hypothetical protein
VFPARMCTCLQRHSSHVRRPVRAAEIALTFVDDRYGLPGFLNSTRYTLLAV